MFVAKPFVRDLRTKELLLCQNVFLGFPPEFEPQPSYASSFEVNHKTTGATGHQYMPLLLLLLLLLLVGVGWCSPYSSRW